MARLKSNQLVDIFDEQMSAVATYKLLEPLNNPCHIMYEGIESYVYVKNLSSAYFSNPDVYRAQLTGIDTLNTIKKSSALFILLGYDSENNVFAVWNPHMAKQRIGTAASPSFYSRLSWQKEAANHNAFLSKELKNDGNVLLFPVELITTFMASIDSFFPDTSEYVAMGSKRRKDANTAYKHLVNTQHLGAFTKYLMSLEYPHEKSQILAKTIKELISKSIISANRKVFLSYDSVDEYTDAVEKFLSLEEVQGYDVLHNNLVSLAFPAYINFLIKEYGESSEEGNCQNSSEEPVMVNEDIHHSQSDDCETDIDYESKCLDANGNLTRITNPKLIELLRKDLDTEYPRPIAAYATIEDFYGDRFANMQISQWQKLFKEIDWNKKEESVSTVYPKVKSKRRPRFKFSMVDIHVGDTVTFTPTKIDVKVASDDEIEYNGNTYSLSRFAILYMPEAMRTKSNVYQGPAFFSFKGELLDDLRSKKENR